MVLAVVVVALIQYASSYFQVVMVFAVVVVVITVLEISEGSFRKFFEWSFRRFSAARFGSFRYSSHGSYVVGVVNVVVSSIRDTSKVFSVFFIHNFEVIMVAPVVFLQNNLWYLQYFSSVIIINYFEVVVVFAVVVIALILHSSIILRSLWYLRSLW